MALSKHPEGEQQLLLLVYVDGKLLFSPSMEQIERTQWLLLDNFKCKMLEDVHYYLELQIARDVERTWLKEHQTLYVSGVLERYGVTGSCTLMTPLPAGFMLKNAAMDDYVLNDELHNGRAACTGPSRPTCLWGASTAFPPTAAITLTTPMASPPVLAFDAEGRPVKFDTWLDDLHLFLQLTAKEDISLYDHALGHATAPAATADSTARSQWQTRDAHARFAIRNARLPDTLRSDRDHFLARCPTELTIALLEKELLAAETSIVAVGASRGDPRTPFFRVDVPQGRAPPVTTRVTPSLDPSPGTDSRLTVPPPATLIVSLAPAVLRR
ncbi:unnamed protein product [Closterium sp. NIES-54]